MSLCSGAHSLVRRYLFGWCGFAKVAPSSQQNISIIRSPDMARNCEEAPVNSSLALRFLKQYFLILPRWYFYPLPLLVRLKNLQMRVRNNLREPTALLWTLSLRLRPHVESSISADASKMLRRIKLEFGQARCAFPPGMDSGWCRSQGLLELLYATTRGRCRNCLSTKIG